jgi:two-component system nitrate/nitrite response regulator NarL
MAIARKSSSCRVLAVDDHPFALESFRVILQQIPNVKLVGTATDGAEAVEKHSALKPHLIIMDESMPRMTGTEAAKQIRRKDGTVKILFYSGHPKAAELAFLAGANGFLTKGAPIAHLQAAIDALRNGGIYIDESVWPELQSRFVLEDPAMPPLTEEERKYVPLLAAGHSSKQIADELGIKLRRVQKVRGRLMHKTRSINTTALIAKMVRYSPPPSPLLPRI